VPGRARTSRPGLAQDLQARDRSTPQRQALSHALLCAEGVPKRPLTAGLPSLPPGRLWAARGRPTLTNDARRRRLARRLTAPGGESVQAGIGLHQFLRNKRQEREQYRREVTPYERQRYLGNL
jgi:hypothetical protein